MPTPLAMRRARLAGQVALQAAAAAAGANDPLAVRELRIWRLVEPRSERRYTVLRIETRGGLRGYGECSHITDQELAESRKLLNGHSASAYEIALRRLAHIPHVAAGVDMALLDIAGQSCKAPVYQILGGPTRNKVRALARLDGEPSGALTQSIQAIAQQGHRAFSAPAPQPRWRNSGKAFVLETNNRAEALRAAGGPNADLVLRGEGRLTPGDAASVAAALERFHLLWFDEPCPLNNLRAVAKISEGSVTPLGFGAACSRASEFQDLLREDAVDIIRPSLALFGITGIRRIATIAEVYYTAVAPHHTGGPVATAAALQLAATLPNFFIQECPAPLPSERPAAEMRARIAGQGLERVSDGYFTLPTGPGLGIRVDENALNEYQEKA
jgi:galactonate dehydratase